MATSKPLRVGGVPEHFNLPWHLAKEQYAFESAGVSVEYIDYPGGTGAMTRGLKDGEIDVALVLSEGAVTNILRGNDIKIVKVYVKSPLIWGIHVAADSEFRSIDDIRDKRYAVSRAGSGSHLMAIVDAAERGWETEGMEFVKVGGLEGARIALAAGDAEVFLWERFMTQPLVDSGEFRRVGERCVPWPAFVVAVSQQTLNTRGQEIRSVFEVVDRQCKSLMDNPKAVEIIVDRYDLKESEVQVWFDHVEWNLGFEEPVEDLKRVISYLEKIDIVDTENAQPEDVWFDLPE